MKARMWTRVTIAVIGVAVFSPITAHGQAELQFGAIPTAITVDNLVVEENVAYLPVAIQHRGDATDFFVTVSSGELGQFDPRYMFISRFLAWLGIRLPYYVYTPLGGIAKDLSVPVDEQSTISGTFTESQSWTSAEETLEFVVPAEQFSRRGDYRDTLTITLYQGSVGQPLSAVEADSVEVDVNSNTGDFSQVLLVSPGGDSSSGQSQYSFDFGALRPYASQRVDMLFRTNMTYTLSLTSANGGNLENTVGGVTYQVPYQFTSNGDELDLGNRRIIGFGLLGTGIEFQRYEFEVMIEEFDLVAPGTYQDVITVTISSGN